MAAEGEPEPRFPQAGEAAATEAALLGRIAGGDQAAFRTVVDRCLPQMLAIARRMLRDSAEAEDVAQEALVRLWRSAATLELGPGGLMPWLRRVVSNLCIDKVRAVRRLTLVDEVPETPVAPRQLDGIGERQLSARVDLALKALPERQRLAISLFHFEGLSQAEVGAALGISDDAVESLLARARRSLKAALKDEWQDLIPDKDGLP